jgi:hypothetical protein
MMMKLQPSATDEELLRVIESWVELLAMGRFDEAFSQILCCSDVGWTPELIRTVITNYGSPEPRRDGKVFRVTPILREHSSGDRYFYEVERYGDDPNRPQEYIGAVAYNLPLNGEWSDLTVMFDLILVDDALVLSLDDIHVL